MIPIGFETKRSIFALVGAAVLLAGCGSSAPTGYAGIWRGFPGADCDRPQGDGWAFEIERVGKEETEGYQLRMMRWPLPYTSLPSTSQVAQVSDDGHITFVFGREATLSVSDQSVDVGRMTFRPHPELEDKILLTGWNATQNETHPGVADPRISVDVFAALQLDATTLTGKAPERVYSFEPPAACFGRVFEDPA